MIFDLGDRRERNLDDLSIRDLNLYTGRREGLGGLHTANCSAHAPAVGGNNLNVIFAVKWLQGCERFGYLQGKFLPVSVSCLLRARKSTEAQRMQPEKWIWRIETCPCILRVTKDR